MKLLTALVTAIVVLAGGVNAGLAQTTTWKIVANNRTTPQWTLWTWLGEEVEKRSKGQIKTEVISQPELGLTGFEMVRVMRAGLVDLADINPSFIAGDLPAVEAVILPGLFGDVETSIKGTAAFLPAMASYSEKLGGVPLGSYIWPQHVLFSRKAIRRPEDMKGLKIRVFGTAQAEFMRAFGAEPVSLPFGEVYTALERGTVDAALTGTYSGFATKWYEVTKYMVDVNYGPVGCYFFVSNRTWSKASPEIRAILTKLGEEFTQRAMELGRQTTREGIGKNVEKGMEFIALSPAMATQARSVLTTVVIPSWAKRTGGDAKTVFNTYLASHAGITLP
jgi:TRAP-type C4-dicarboxylate transport system substrate-binding protein